MNAPPTPTTRSGAVLPRRRMDSGIQLASSAEKTELHAPITFHIEGETSVVAHVPSGDSLVTSVEGVVLRDQESRLWLSGPQVSSTDGAGSLPGDGVAVASLGYTLPAAVSLAPLVGKRLRVTLLQEWSPCGTFGQTLTLSGHDGRVWLIARHGSVDGVVHKIQGKELRAALSQRAGGPLVIGTPELQWLVGVGERVTVAATMVAHFLARNTAGCAAYVIADLALC